MKTPDQTEVKPSALDDALVSVAIIASSPSTQQAVGLLALMLFTLRGVIL